MNDSFRTTMFYAVICDINYTYAFIMKIHVNVSSFHNLKCMHFVLKNLQAIYDNKSWFWNACKMKKVFDIHAYFENMC